MLRNSRVYFSNFMREVLVRLFSIIDSLGDSRITFGMEGEGREGSALMYYYFM